MKTENASRSVIENTRGEIKHYARFYFRPFTPTQYYNEGYKHEDIRKYGRNSTNIIIPVFFIFKLRDILRLPNVYASERTLACREVDIVKDIHRIADFDFQKIYSNGIASDKSEFTYRHAEIIVKDSLKLDYLEAIVLRNDIERRTFLNLLKDTCGIELYHKYKGLVRVCKTDLFYRNAFFIEGISYRDGVLSISFNNSFDKIQYKRRNNDSIPDSSLKVPLFINIVWRVTTGKIENYFAKEVNYFDDNVQIYIGDIKEAVAMRVVIKKDASYLCNVVIGLRHGDLPY